MNSAIGKYLVPAIAFYVEVVFSRADDGGEIILLVAVAGNIAVYRAVNNGNIRMAERT